MRAEIIEESGEFYYVLNQKRGGPFSSRREAIEGLLWQIEDALGVDVSSEAAQDIIASL